MEIINLEVKRIIKQIEEDISYMPQDENWEILIESSDNPNIMNTIHAHFWDKGYSIRKDISGYLISPKTKVTAKLFDFQNYRQTLS